jgi:hypothetical protein
MRRSVLFALLLALCCVRPALASPVHLPGHQKGGDLLMNDDLRRKWGYAKDADFLLDVEYDSLQKRRLDEFSAEAEGSFIDAKAIVTWQDRFDVYALAGALTDASYTAELAGVPVRFELEDRMLWGGGTGAVLFRCPVTGLGLFTDFNYRQVTPMRYDAVIVNGAKFTRSQIDGFSKARWQEWQAALGADWETEWFRPYAGVKYSDVRAAARATVSGTLYDLGHVASKETLGFFAGLQLGPVNGAGLDLQASFGDEDSVSGRLVFKY